MAEEVIVDYFSQMVSALSYLHVRGVLHRDLKPSNVLLMRCVGVLLTISERPHSSTSPTMN